MISDDYISLVQRLLDRTKSGDVNWKLTANENEFMIYFKKFSLSVRHTYDQHEDMEYTSITLRDDSGEEIDQFWIDTTDPHWNIVNDLYAVARRRALHIDDALHIIMKELDSDGSVGLEEKPLKPSSAIEDDVPF